MNNAIDTRLLDCLCSFSIVFLKERKRKSRHWTTVIKGIGPNSDSHLSSGPPDQRHHCNSSLHR